MTFSCLKLKAACGLRESSIKTLLSFSLHLSSRALDTIPASLSVNHRAGGVKHKQMAAAFEWRLCTIVTVSLLIMVEMIHSWGGDINQAL